MRERIGSVKSMVSQAGTEAPDARASILLVDDREENLAVLELILKDFDCDLVTARSGQEALKILFDQDFAVILLDVRMPGMDGFETAEFIRQRQRSKNTPIILITAADVSSDQIIRGYSAGAVDFIFKPFVHQLLAAKVRIFIELFRKSEKLRVSEERFRLLVERVKDYAIFMLDTEGGIVSWNLGAERISGYRQNEIVGKHFSVFYPLEDVQAGEPANGLKMTVAETRFEEEGWRIRKDGSRFWAHVVITPVRDEQGNLRGFAQVTRDVTELKEAAQVLSELPARLLQSQDEPRQRIAHELHDSTSPALAGAISRLYMLKNRARDWDTKASTALQDSLALAENVAREIRNLSERLYSRALEQAGFVSAVPSEAFGKESGVRVELDLSATSGHLPQHLEIVLFSDPARSSAVPPVSVQQPIGRDPLPFNQGRTHAGNKRSSRENGCGRSWPPERRKTGLEMRLAGPGERIKQLGGNLAISTRSGIIVRAVVPVHPNSVSSEDVIEP